MNVCAAAGMRAAIGTKFKCSCSLEIVGSSITDNELMYERWGRFGGDSV